MAREQATPQFRSISSLIDELDEVVENAKGVPFSSNKSVNADELKEIIQDMRLYIPDEIKNARAIATNREEILKAARDTAAKTIEDAEIRAAQMVTEHEITEAARKAGNEIIDESKQKAAEIMQNANNRANDVKNAADDYSRKARSAANKYVEDILHDTDLLVTDAANKIRDARINVRKASQTRPMPSQPVQGKAPEDDFLD